MINVTWLWHKSQRSLFFFFFGVILIKESLRIIDLVQIYDHTFVFGVQNLATNSTADSFAGHTEEMLNSIEVILAILQTRIRVHNWLAWNIGLCRYLLSLASVFSCLIELWVKRGLVIDLRQSSFLVLVVELDGHFCENCVVDWETLYCIELFDELQTKGTTHSLVTVKVEQTLLAKGVATVD